MASWEILRPLRCLHIADYKGSVGLLRNALTSKELEFEELEKQGESRMRELLSVVQEKDDLVVGINNVSGSLINE